MTITVICPHLKCRSILQVPESARGQKVRCSRCGRNFIVPGNRTGTGTTNPPANQPASK